MAAFEVKNLGAVSQPLEEVEIKFRWPVRHEYDKVLACRVAKLCVDVEEKFVARGRENKN